MNNSKNVRGLAALLVALAPLAATAVEARPIDLPETGQTVSYLANRNDGLTALVAVPDDGALERGVSASYTDNGDGTITDNVTGLQWEKKGDNGGLHDKDNAYRWTGTGTQETIWDWLDDVNAEGGTGFAGYSDWRIPNAKELETLLHYQSAAPMTASPFRSNCVAGVSPIAGSCTVSGHYWTSTTRANSTSMAWSVNFFQGLVGPNNSKDVAVRVRAVRAGSPTFPATGQLASYLANKNDGIVGAVAVPDDGAVRAGAPLSFTDNGNGTLTDNNTGLVWEKKGDNGGLHDKDNSYYVTGNGVDETVWDWIEDVNASGLGGASDWRIPNVRELLSIADLGATWGLPLAFRAPCSPNVTPIVGSCALQVSYWTSTADSNSIVNSSPILAWYVGSLGQTDLHFRASNFRTRAVRGGAQKPSVRVSRVRAVRGWQTSRRACACRCDRRTR